VLLQKLKVRVKPSTVQQTFGFVSEDCSVFNPPGQEVLLGSLTKKHVTGLKVPDISKDHSTFSLQGQAVFLDDLSLSDFLGENKSISGFLSWTQRTLSF
jgi:hypothetical protein